MGQSLEPAFGATGKTFYVRTILGGKEVGNGDPAQLLPETGSDLRLH